MKPKTLKDLTTDWLKSTKGKNKGWGFVNVKILKKLAIKWVKYYSCDSQIKDKSKYRDFIIISKAKREVLIDLCNLTEEDLK